MARIGKYELLEQLGSGSMGTVYRGRDTILDRPVAIKTIQTGDNVAEDIRERFYREARVCARLNHPNVVSVYDLGEEDGTCFIAMELLSGSDFGQLIERRENILLPVKLNAMAQVCEALAHAHREGVIHRDIKPSNLFLLADGRAKVVDFGIARLSASQLTRAGSVLGTPNYMSPEQLENAPCDGRSDLFSAAIVFFEFLTFHHPFESNLIPRRIKEDRPDSLLAQNPALPAELEAILMKAMAKDPADRFTTGDELAGALRDVKIPVPAAPPEPEHDRKRLKMALAGLGLGAVLLVIAPSYFRAQKPESFVATARVAMPMAHILDRPEDGAKEVASKSRGAELNVLTMPKSTAEGWVRVQARDGDVYSHPGYVKAVDLTEWSPKDPDAALALARMSGPMEAGTDAEIRTQIDRLNSVAAAYQGKPAGTAASLDCARLEFTLIKHAKDAGQPAADWQTLLADLTNQVEDLRKNPALQSGGDTLLRQIHDLISGPSPVVAGANPPALGLTPGANPGAALPGSSPQTPVPSTTSTTPPAVLTDVEIQGLLQSADQLRKDHRYNDARRVAMRALRSQPKNSDAQVLLKKIDAAIELERSAQ
jgi:predicted Ser/Thr protein kinase